MEKKPKKILLVDDDVDLLEQNKMLLESKGFQVITAETVDSAFETFQNEKPDACILDLIMEEHDAGFILSHRIKRDEYGKTIPVFLLTSATYVTGLKFGTSTSEEKEWIHADGWFNKPIQIDDLVSKLDAAFAEYKKKNIK